VTAPTTDRRDRWWYLTEPYEQLLNTLDVRVVSSGPPIDWPAGREFMTGIVTTPSGGIAYVTASTDLTGMEREYAVRGLLAAWHGIDTAGWPVAMDLTGRAS
jgi:hypothetical protein